MPVVIREKLISNTSIYIIKANKSARRCNLVFKSGYELLAHKKANWAHSWKKRKIVNIASTETNQRTITDIFTTPTENPEEYEAESHAFSTTLEIIDENVCGNCEGKYLPGSGDWLLCKNCRKWFHEDCI